MAKVPLIWSHICLYNQTKKVLLSLTGRGPYVLKDQIKSKFMTVGQLSRLSHPAAKELVKEQRGNATSDAAQEALKHIPFDLIDITKNTIAIQKLEDIECHALKLINGSYLNRISSEGVVSFVVIDGKDHNQVRLVERKKNGNILKCSHKHFRPDLICACTVAVAYELNDENLVKNIYHRRDHVSYDTMLNPKESKLKPVSKFIKGQRRRARSRPSAFKPKESLITLKRKLRRSLSQRMSKRPKVQVDEESLIVNESEENNHDVDDAESSQKFVSDDQCHECGEGCYLLCCDSCPKAFHKECLDPPLKRMPNKNKQWKCMYCLDQ